MLAATRIQYLGGKKGNERKKAQHRADDWETKSTPPHRINKPQVLVKEELN